MRLLRVNVEGLPGTPSSLSIEWNPGFNVVKAKGSFKVESVLEIVESLLYPSFQARGRLGPGGAAKADLTIASKDNVFRIQREYGSNAISLDELEAGSKDRYRQISKDSHFISEKLTRALKLPGRATFISLLVGRPGRFGDTKQNGDEEKPNLVSDFDKAKERLQQLLDERERIRKIDEIQFEVDGLQSKVFEIEDQLRKFDEPREAQKRNDEELSQYEIFDDPELLTPEILTRLRVYPSLGQKKRESLAAVQEKLDLITQDRSQHKDRPYWLEPMSLGGMGAALLGFVASSFLRSYVWAFLPVVVIGLGLTIWGFIRGMRRENEISLLEKRINALEVEKTGIERRFETETAAVRKVFEAVGTKDPEEILARVEHREQLLMEKTRLAEMNEILDREIPEEELKRKLEETKAEIVKYESELKAMPPVAVDPNAIEQEIMQLEALVRAEGEGAIDSKEVESRDSIHELIQSAANLFSMAPLDFLTRLEKGLNHNISTMSRKRFSGVLLDMGQIVGFHSAEGPSLPWSKLSPAARELMLFCIQFTLWQVLSKPFQYPVILDLVTNTDESSLNKLSLSATQHLAKQTQVLVLSS